MSFNKDKARAVLEKLPLSALSRAFGECWLALMCEKGCMTAPDFEARAPGEVQLRTIGFEISPGMVRITSAGSAIVEAVGANLVGEDYLLMAPPAQRPTRLARMCTIVEGHISTHQRWVVNTAGKLHVLNELALPSGLSENGLPTIMTYVDTDNVGAIGHIPPKRGAMNIAPVFETYPIHQDA